MAQHDAADLALKVEIRKVLEAIHVKDLPVPPQIIQFPSNASLNESFSTLIEKKILSAPVFDHQTHEYIGFLDIRDLVSYVVHAEKAKVHRRHYCLKDLIDYVPLVSDVEVTISYLARRHRFLRVDETATLFDVAKILRTRNHRVPVVNSEGKIVNIISQSVIVKHMRQHLKEMPSLTAISVSKAGLGSAPVVKCHADTPALLAFEMLDNKGRFGMAVIGQDDALVSQTSVDDLKLWLNMPSSELLDLPILKFLQKIREQDLDIQVPVLSCSEKDSLAFMIQKLDATRSHRIYVVDAHFRPMKVVSLTDVVNLCIQEE